MGFFLLGWKKGFLYVWKIVMNISRRQPKEIIKFYSVQTRWGSDERNYMGFRIFIVKATHKNPHIPAEHTRRSRLFTSLDFIENIDVN